MYRKIVFAVILALTFALNASAIGPSKTRGGETSAANAQVNPQSARHRGASDTEETSDNETSDADASAKPNNTRYRDVSSADETGDDQTSDANAPVKAKRVRQRDVSSADEASDNSTSDADAPAKPRKAKHRNPADAAADGAILALAAALTAKAENTSANDSSDADAPAKPKKKRRLDLADTAAGTYFGEVISDARGSSQSGVEITVRRIAPNTVSVTSSYPRLPAFTTRLTRAMQTIQHTGGDASIVFLLDLSKSPRHLDVTVDDASWSGDKQQNIPQPEDEQ
ncbi:hypothetical protein [Rudaea sp.]|uniref:hypothetical protein n=1 Tax=Rudaea sp. TaxID=2136325 RepID=UPI002ED2B348